jgi:hypothetical protein
LILGKEGNDMSGLAGIGLVVSCLFNTLTGDFDPRCHDLVVDFGASGNEAIVATVNDGEISVKAIDSAAVLNGAPNVIDISGLKNVKGLQAQILDKASDAIGPDHGGAFLETIEAGDLDNIRVALEITKDEAGSAARNSETWGWSHDDSEMQGQYTADLANFHAAGDALNSLALVEALPSIAEGMEAAVLESGLSGDVQGTLIKTLTVPTGDIASLIDQKIDLAQP